jgi:ketosteroid isomerase-like protein
METDGTRKLIHRYLEARAANDYDGVYELLADDVEWFPPQTAPVGPFRGREEVAKALVGGAAGTALDVSTMKRDIHKVLADGDSAVVQLTLTAQSLKGKSYENEYCWIYSCRDDRIQRLDEYVDTLHAGRILGWKLD